MCVLVGEACRKQNRVAKSPRAPPLATAIQNDAVVVGVGSSHDEVRLASAGGCDRRQDGGQQLLQCSALGKIDPVCSLRSMEFSEGRGRGGLKSKQRICFHNDAVWCLAWLSGTAARSPPPSHPAEPKGQGVASRLRRSVMTAPMSAGALALEVALKELLREREVYEVGPAAVDLAPYRCNLVSLPANLEGSPNLADLLPPDGRRDEGSR